MTSPTSMPLHLLALEKVASEPAGSTSDAPLRSAIVNVASYYLRLARTNTPAQMEAMIWGKDSIDGADHGESCAAFASLTLELAAQAVGKQSWVTGGTTYPWPLHEWADVRVDSNPDSLGIISVLQDAQSHDRWHPLGDGYQPQPGDWVLFDGHVEVVTGYANGVLDTIGADSLPNLTVNAHSFPAPLADQGVVGFVDNGHLSDGPPTAAQPGAAQPGAAPGAAPAGKPAGGQRAGSRRGPADTAGAAGSQGNADIPGIADIPGMVASGPGAGQAGGGVSSGVKGAAAVPTAASGADHGSGAARGLAAIPGVIGGPGAGVGAQAGAGAGASGAANSASSAPYRKNSAQEQPSVPQTRAQQAFISEIAPGAMAAQQRYGVPASVTIAQAIDESGWGRSDLAAQDRNLFGIKGTGPAGSVVMPTQEYINGQWVTVNAEFRVYHNIAESIADHTELLATSGYYQRAMADRAVPDAFANDLTGIYATDPDYGANLIAVMRLYNLYRFDTPGAPAGSGAQPHASGAAQAPTAGHAQVPGSAHAPAGAATPGSAMIPGSGVIPGTGNARAYAAAPGMAAIPGLTADASAQAPRATAVHEHPAHRQTTQPRTTQPRTTQPRTTQPRTTQPRTTRSRTAQPRPAAVPARAVPRGGALIPGLVAPVAPRYEAELPSAVTTAYFTTAKTPIARAAPLYRDVASQAGIRWELLAACDWMQCQSDPRYSPVLGEKIGMPHADGTVYLTKSGALAQCARDLIRLSARVYGIDLTAPGILSVRELADAFAAFRWGALLRRHGVSAMEFPYSVAGLTPQHMKMHWPAISEPDAPDKPGGKFRMPFGAVPLVLTLNYPATV